MHDFRKPPQPFANPARYAVDLPTLIAAFPGLANDPIALAVASHIIPQALFNRCPIDYFTPPLRAALTARLSDFDGAPLASGTPKCHSHMQDVPGTAHGNWWNDTDPTHDALFAEEQALALANWNVTPSVQLLSLNQNVPGFSHALLEAGASPDDVNSTFEFPVRPGPQRTNRRFDEITDDAIYCYDHVRVHRGGPRLRAVILLQVRRPRRRAIEAHHRIRADKPLPRSAGTMELQPRGGDLLSLEAAEQSCVHVYLGIYMAMTIAKSKTFKSGNSEAVRLPKEVAFGDEVELIVVRSGDVVTLYPARLTLAEMAERLAELPAPSSIEQRDTDELPERRGL